MKPIVPKKYREIYIQTGKQKVLEILFSFPDKEFSLSDLILRFTLLVII